MVRGFKNKRQLQDDSSECSELHLMKVIRIREHPVRGVGEIVGSLLWKHHSLTALKGMAGTTGLEPAASAVTGQRSNQLNYVPAVGIT